MKDQNQYQFSLPKELTALIDGEPISLENWPVARQQLEEKPGLYVFWWIGDPAILQGDQDVKFTGPAVANEDDEDGDGAHVSCFVISEEDQLLKIKGRTCLYVGKSTNVRRRIREHQMGSLDSNEFLAVKQEDGTYERTGLYQGDEPSTVFKRNSSCQFRAGMEYLFRNRSIENPDIVMDAIRAHVKVSYIELHNKQDQFNGRTDAFKRRFYWEDLLIGVLQPWFNLDGER